MMRVAECRECFELLGIEWDRLAHVQSAGDIRQANDRLVVLQADIRSAWKAKAFELHPDRNPGDAEAEATFKRLNAFVAKMATLKIVPSRIPMWTRTAPVQTSTASTGWADVSVTAVNGTMGATRVWW